MRQQGIIKKGWGKEQILFSTDLYCGKILHFNTGGKCSMHFHHNKTESWYILTGKFILTIINTKDASLREFTLNIGDTWYNSPLMPHQLFCVEQGSIIEVSTPDSVEDNFRVSKGDSQK